MRVRVLLLSAALIAAAGLRPGAQESPSATHAWAGACKDCHEPIYAAWEKSKHAKALDRLSSAQREQECAGCHLTGSAQPIREGGVIVNAGVQCESCHGAGKAHVEKAKAGTPTPEGLKKKPDPASCEACHNSKSPHFRGFVYGAMASFVHKVPK